MEVDPWLLGPLRVFEIAGRLLSFTKAAATLHLTQSAVSQQIRLLEERLGFPLFFRHSRGLRLTAQGYELLQSVQRSFAEIISTLDRLNDQNATTLEVNCLPSLALHWLVPRLNTYYRRHPEVPVRLNADLQALDQHRMLQEGIDIGVRYEPADQTNASCTKLMEEYLLPVASPEYLAQHAALQTKGSCNGVTFLHDASPWAGAPEYIEWRQWMKAYRPQWLHSIAGPQFNLASMMIGAALNHQGIALGRTAIVLDELKSGRLVDVTGAHLLAPAHYCLIHSPSAQKSAAAFVAWLRGEAAAFTQERKALFSSPALG